ncbi:intersectin-1-like isoform X5 [Penaeus japonicus]|uniref:intersectin-1-like isoform X5 n=1 Tax=Penaeus japonicus TaxID=27405 RepID=UPI001C71772B|nr:intersectin-1-like isoform X5 [Penaeus japonicus]
MADPWIVTPGERVKHEEQFNTLRPAGVFITGEQAKGFFLQSRLPPPVLGIIWALSDVNGDGKMDIHEFSIACKLINLKLRGFNLPQTLPASLKQSACPPSSAGSTPILPGVAAAPVSSSAAQAQGSTADAASVNAPASVAPAGMIAGSTGVRPVQSVVPGGIPLPGMVNQAMPTQPLVPASMGAVSGAVPATSMPAAPVGIMNMAGAPAAPMVAAPVAQVAPNMAQPMQAAVPPVSGIAAVGPVASVPPVGIPAAPAGIPAAPAGIPAAPVGIPAAPGGIPAAPVGIPAAPGGIPAAPAGAPVQRTASQDSGGAQTPGDWAVPQASKLKYTQVFNMTDRTKSGYLSGVQARNILIQSQLPQQALAQIWALSDVDNDGRLSCEEFVLAMFLCESAKAGSKIPTVLPADLIPPTNRRQRTSSIHSAGSGGTPVSEVLGAANDNTFEDKRRENFEKGQAELERRRKALLDAQRRETEERLRREREEEAKREKARLDAERRRQEELEREMQRQREVEAQREQERKRQEEMREQARKDAELQRQQEWEKQRLQELMNVRQRQQENLLSLKAKNQSLTIELSTKEDRVKELTQKISETRVGVTEVKATIDTMRSTRDTYMADMNQLKASARDQNQRLLALNQEKARLKARNSAAAGAGGIEQAAVDASLANKQMVIKQLQEKVEELQKEFSMKEEDVNNNISDLTVMKNDLQATAERCREIFTEYSSKREQVLGLREKLVNPDAAWGDDASSAWAGKGFGSGGTSAWNAWPTTEPKDAWPSSRADDSGPTSIPQPEQEQHKPQETTEQHLPPARPPPPSTTTTTNMPSMATTGTVNEEEAQPPAPQGFPATQKDIWGSNTTSAVGWGVHTSTSHSSSTTTPTTTTSTIHPEPATTAAEEPSTGGALRYRALYQFDARNHDELSFMPGDIITVTMSENAEPGWLGGELCGQTGWFPEAYCEPIEGKAEPVVASETQDRTQLENIPEEIVSAPAEQKKLGEAVGVFPWRAKQNNHLSFNKGDRIVVREQQDQWWYGELNGAGGWFPHSFVKMVSGPDAVTSPVSSPQEAPAEPPMPENLVNDEISEYYQALYPYQSGEPGDLTFNAGEIILVVKKEGDWWHGIINQKCGIFPSNYVQILPNQFITTRTGDTVAEQNGVMGGQIQQDVEAEMQPVAEQQVVTEENQEAGKGKKPEIAQVIAPYDATSGNQLSLQRGQLVMIRKKTASGWWEGELQAKGKKRQIGWFPATYVKVLGGSSRSTPVSMELTNREDAPPDCVQSPQSAQPQVTQVTITPPADDPMAGLSDASNGFAEQVEALYPYTAMNDDELTFEAGAIISVIDKEDAAWWKGTLNGVIGVFPSNYIQPYSPNTAAASGTPEGEFSLCYEEKQNYGTGDRHTWHFDPLSSEEQKRQNVIQEIISTEASYLCELQLVEQAFVQPMRSSGIVTEKELDLIFVNWSELILVNSYFDKALKVRCVNSNGGFITMVADVLCQQIAQLTPYLRFCSLQIQGATLLGEKCSAGGPWANLIKQCQEQPTVRGLTLTSFLLKPMQRITRYPLLIKELLKYTPEGHPDHHNSQEALVAATTLCAQVNEAVSQRDNTDKLEWMQRQVICEGLQERLVFNSLTNTLGPRKLLHTGVLNKTKSKRELVMFLLSDFLLLTTPSKSVASHTSLAALERALTSLSCTMYRKPMFLTDVRIEVDKESELCFTLISPTCGDVAVSAPTPHERGNWLKKIAIAQKHISDTERSILQRKHSKEKDLNIMGRVLVTVMAGVSLSERQTEGTLQSFCEVSLGSQVHRTSIAASPHPKWDSTMQFLVKALAEDVLCITVYEKGYFKPNEFLGRTEIKINQVHEESKNQPGTQPQVHKLQLQEVKSGEVILKISLQLFERS